MSKLTLLFEHILNTEQQFQLKSKELKELSDNQESVKRDLKNAKDRVISLLGEIIIRNNQLSSESSNLVGNESQIKILLEQKKTLDLGNNKLKDNLGIVEEELILNNNALKNQGKQFSSKVINNRVITKPNDTEVKCIKLGECLNEKISILSELKDKETAKLGLENGLYLLRDDKKYKVKELEIIVNRTLEIENRKLELERERNQLDKKNMEHDFQDLKQKLELTLIKKGKKERAIIEITKETDHVVRIKHQEELKISQNYSRSQFTQQEMKLQQPSTSYCYSRGVQSQSYNTHKYNVKTISSCNEQKIRNNEGQVIEINSGEVEGIVDWSDISDFEELD